LGNYGWVHGLPGPEMNDGSDDVGQWVESNSEEVMTH